VKINLTSLSDKKLLVAAGLLYFFLPFERIPTLDLFGFTVKISYLLFLLFLLFFAKKTVYFFKKKPLDRSDLALLLLWLTGGISLLYAPDLKRGLVVLSMWGFVFLFYFIFSRILTSSEIRRNVEKVIIISSIIVSIFGIIQFIGDSIGIPMSFTGLRLQYTKIVLGFPRIQSVALEPLYFSNFLFVPLFLSIKKYIQTNGFLNKHIFVILLFVTNIILGISRGAYLGLIIALALLLLFGLSQYKKDKHLLKKIGLVLGAAAFSLVLSFASVLIFNGKSALSNFSGHAAVDDTKSGSSVPGRLEGYKTALKIFYEKPIFGNGLASFGIKTAGNASDIQQFGYGIVNNEYLEILTETGIVGLIAFATFFLSLAWLWLRAFRKTLQKLPLIIISLGILAVMIQYNFFSTLYIIYIWAFLALMKGEINDTEN